MPQPSLMMGVYRRIWTCHLTPGGWIRDESAPPGCVETWKVLEQRRGYFGTWYRTWSCVWAPSTVSRAERDALRARYPVDGWRRYRLYVNDRVGEPLGDPTVPGRPSPPAAAPADISLPPAGLATSPLAGLAMMVLLVLGVVGGLYLLAPANSYVGAFFAGKCDANPAPPECNRSLTLPSVSAH